MSQTDEILTHLKRKRTITPMEALKLYGSFRLAARVKDLKNAGHVIQTHMVNSKGKKFAKYQYLGGVK